MACLPPFPPATVTVNCKIVSVIVIVTVILTLNSCSALVGYISFLLNRSVYSYVPFVSIWLNLPHLAPSFGVFFAQLKTSLLHQI